MNKLIYKERRFHFDIFIVFCLLFLCYPFVFNRLIGGLNESVVMIIFFLILGFYYIQHPHIGSTIPSLLLKCVTIQCIIWLCYCFIHQDFSYTTRLFMTMLSLLALHYLISNRNVFKFTSCFNHIICIMAVCGIPVFFMYALGLITPIAEYTNVDGRPLYFFGLTCSNAVFTGICRVAGFFDEPGALAFWGIIALLFNKLYFDNKKIEFGLIISLLTTLSAAYFVQLLMYVVLFYGGKIKNLIIISIIIGAVGFVTFKKLGDNPQLAYLTIERFEGGEIRSDRGEMTVDTKKIFESSPIFGVGGQKSQELGYFADNPYEIPAKDGIVGFIVTYLPLFVIAIRYGRKHKDFLFAVLILAAGYMQRPFHINIMHYLILFLFVILSYYSYEREDISI